MIIVKVPCYEKSVVRDDRPNRSKFWVHTFASPAPKVTPSLIRSFCIRLELVTVVAVFKFADSIA